MGFTLVAGHTYPDINRAVSDTRLHVMGFTVEGWESA